MCIASTEIVHQAEGTAPLSFVSESIEKHKHLADFNAQKITIKDVGAQIFGGTYL
jgi:hypothetical protein